MGKVNGCGGVVTEGGLLIRDFSAIRMHPRLGIHYSAFDICTIDANPDARHSRSNFDMSNKLQYSAEIDRRSRGK